MSTKKDEALKQALGVLVEVTNYTGSEAWSPSMTRDCERVIKYIKDAQAEQPAQQQEPWEHLKAYGYAPGGYMMTCRGCNTTVIDVDKRASRCKPCAIKALKAKQQEPTIPDNSQEWRGMDGATAYWLIQRHADGWADIGKMMGEWLAANQPAQQEPVAHENSNGVVHAAGYPWSDKEVLRPLVYGDTTPQPSPSQSDIKPLTDEQQVAEALRRHGLTLVKTATGYDVLKLGQITAHGIKGDA